MIRRILLPCAAAILAAAGLWYAAAGRNRTTYFLLEGTSLETEVCEIRGKDEARRSTSWREYTGMRQPVSWPRRD